MRKLSAGEVALVEEAFGDRVDCGRVRLRFGAGRNAAAIAAFRKGNTAITLRRNIYFRTYYSEDFSQAGVLAQSLFHHEMTHVWQYAVLGVSRFLARYSRDLAACRFNARAMYRYEEGETPFPRARLEAQAQMVGDYCHARLVGDAPRMARLARNLKGSGFYGL
ncbi:MAG: eCIS core domain-containing protein [Allosphingosinicella sp.]